MERKQKISYVIPCYRSEHTIGDVVADISQTMGARPEYDYEIILVNDGSPDGTGQPLQSWPIGTAMYWPFSLCATSARLRPSWPGTIT